MQDREHIYTCDDCGVLMQGYHRYGDLALCGDCRTARKLAVEESESRHQKLEAVDYLRRF